MWAKPTEAGMVCTIKDAGWHVGWTKVQNEAQIKPAREQAGAQAKPAKVQNQLAKEQGEAAEEQPEAQVEPASTGLGSQGVGWAR